MLKVIRPIAAEVRGWAEQYAYDTYMAKDLRGMCAIASSELWRRLTKAGLKPFIQVWEDHESHPDYILSHVFINVEGYIVDVTATQFAQMKQIPVYIEKDHVAQFQYKWYTHSMEFRTVKDLVKWQKRSRWPITEISWE